MYSKKLRKRNRTKWNLLKLYKIEAKRRSSSVIVKKRKNKKKEESFFFGKKRRKTNIIVPQLSKICHCYSRVPVPSSELAPLVTSPASKCAPPPPPPPPPPEPKEVGQHLLVSEGAGGANSDDWRESLALCLSVDGRMLQYLKEYRIWMTLTMPMGSLCMRNPRTPCIADHELQHHWEDSH